MDDESAIPAEQIDPAKMTPAQRERFQKLVEERTNSGETLTLEQLQELAWHAVRDSFS